MKDIRIISLSLNNWRGQTRTIDFGGSNAVISGCNHSGKSSAMNAFLWCITGFDSEDRSNYLLFDDRVEQTHDNAVPAEVEVRLSVDGEDSALKRVATQGWVRRRGTDIYERDGSDKYTFFLNGIERSSGQFAQDIEYIFGAPKDKLKIMLNLAYFISLDWKVQRKHLGDIIGEVNKSDFKEPIRFDFIFNDLSRFSIEEIRGKYKALLCPMKESMQRLPIEIDTIKQNMPSLDGVEEAKAKKAECDAEIDRIDRMIADRSSVYMEASESRIKAIREINVMEESLESGRREYQRMIENSPQMEEARKNLEEVIASNRNIATQKAQDTMDLCRLKNKLQSLKEKSEWHEAQRASLKNKLEEVKSRTFSEDRCPYCKQELPADMLERAKEKFYEAIDKEKALIVKQGKDNNVQWESIKKEIAQGEAFVAEMENKTYQPVDASPYEARISSVRDSFPKYEESVEYKEKVAQIEEKRANLPSVESSDNSELLAKKKELLGQIESCIRIIASEQARKSQELIISKKQAMLKSTAEEMARCEGKLNAIADYERERAEIIRTRVNGLFHYCEVCMETTDKSGNTIPACIIKDCDGVDFRVTNTASQIMCKVDISKAFQSYYGISLPLLIDNCEAVNEDNMPSHFGQMVELRVSGSEFSVETK